MRKTILIIAISLIVLWNSSKYFPCPSWLGWLVEMENPLAKENRSGSIIGHLKIKPNMIVADIGCGPGRVTIPLAKSIGESGKIVAIDLQQAMLDRVKAKISSIKNIELRKQNIADQPLEKDQYDCILLVNVLGEIPDQNKAIKNIFDGLKKNGTVSITETVFDPHFQSKQKAEKLLQNHGFNKIAFFGPWYSYTVHGIK